MTRDASGGAETSGATDAGPLPGGCAGAGARPGPEPAAPWDRRPGSADPASFRDPANVVFTEGARVLRGLDGPAVAAWRAVSASAFWAEAQRSGSVVATRDLGPHNGWASVLEHERVPFVSYPYEWSFTMLADAAALHLDLLAAALGEGITAKDGYAYNVAFVGSRPVFLDVGSFEPATGGPWLGYRQFCQTFLYPLMIEAYLGVAFQPFLRGRLEGITPSEMRRLLRGRARWRRGVLRHVVLHALAEQRVTGGGEAIRRDLDRSGFGTELSRALVVKLRRLVTRFRSRRADSAWASYRRTCSYDDDDRRAKEAFVAEVLAERRRALVWDLGTNDGAYARTAAAHAEVVLAVDQDDVTVDALYRSLRTEGPPNVTPLVMDLTDPSPARGWRGRERAALWDRGRPDLVLALALVHHLTIAANVPLPEVVDWLAGLGGELVVEFVAAADPMAQRLLANKRSGQHDDYRLERFEALLGRAGRIRRRVDLPGGTRTLYHLERGAGGG